MVVVVVVIVALKTCIPSLGLLGAPPPPPCAAFRFVVVSLRFLYGEAPLLPFTCWVGLLLFVHRCSRCSCCCHFYIGEALEVAWCAVCASVAHF